MPERKTLQELNLSDDFLFAKVMEDSEICRQVLERILGKEIQKIIIQPSIQKVIENAYESKGIRLDVYVKDEMNTIYSVEMQTTNQKDLPKRTRYYQGAVDLDSIRRGESYKKLNKSYIIFICTFDPFMKDNYYYSFCNRCDQYPDIKLGDDTQKIFLNTKGTGNDVSNEIKEFLHYVEKSTDESASQGSELIKNVHKRVNAVKLNKLAEVEYMTLLMRENEKYEAGMEAGMEAGKKEILLKAYHKGKSVKEIADLFDMQVEEVEQLLK